MKLIYLGTGAAEGVPAIFCHCATCEEIRKRGKSEIHTRSQIIIDDELSIDFPPDAYYHSIEMGTSLSDIKYLLVTHSHMDHFYAHDFILRGGKYSIDNLSKLEIYGNEEIEKVFDECTRREMKDNVKENIKMNVIFPFMPFSVGNGKYIVTALKAQHTLTENAYVYLIEKEGKNYLHLTDTGRLSKETLDYLEKYFSNRKDKVGLVSFDCTYFLNTAGAVSRHMGVGDNIVMKDEFFKRNIVDKNTKFVITHFSHNCAPLRENLDMVEKKYGMIAAFDGMEIVL